MSTNKMQLATCLVFALVTTAARAELNVRHVRNGDEALISCPNQNLLKVARAHKLSLPARQALVRDLGEESLTSWSLVRRIEGGLSDKYLLGARGVFNAPDDGSRIFGRFAAGGHLIETKGVPYRTDRYEGVFLLSSTERGSPLKLVPIVCTVRFGRDL